MKKERKHIIAVIMLGSLGIGFMPLASVGGVGLSAADIVKMGFARGSGSAILQKVQEMVGNYMRNYSYMVLACMILIAAVAVLTAVLPAEAAYLVSIAGQAVVNVFAGVLYFQVRSRIHDLKNTIDSVRDIAGGFLGIIGPYDLGRVGEVKVHALPVVLWIVMYLGALALAVRGLLAKEKKLAFTRPADILPESFRQGRNTYGGKSEGVEKPEKRQKPFYGAITGETGIYASKILFLEDRVPVYFCREGQQLTVLPRPSGEAAAEVYYVAEYREYCVKPYQRLTVFLESGQPLGAGREYYIPRGMRIYFEDRDQSFVLE